MSISMRSQLNPAWSGTLRGQEYFPDPFCDAASLAMPENLRTALQWCEFVFNANGTYRMAMERVLAYFLTDVEIGGDQISDDEKEKYLTFLNEVVDIRNVLSCGGRDRQCYGNAFLSLVVPFRRYLICPKCFSQHPLNVVYDEKVFRFSWDRSALTFNAWCPKCSFQGEWIVQDQPEDVEQKLKIKRWAPQEMEILHDPFTDDCAYLWRIPEDYKRLVRAGSLYHLERVPMPVLQSIRLNQLFRFAPEAIYHLKEPTLAGLRNRGWGISRTLTNFRQIWYVQVLKRYNEAIALDYVIPFRLITPAPRSGSSADGAVDPLLNMDMGDFMGSVRNMIRRRRRDPAGWNTLPFPVQYQALGGDATQLAPKELIDQGQETLLNDAGTPVELYRGSLSIQSAPTALRVYEATWHPFVHDLNGVLRWLVKQISQLLGWEVVDAKLQRVTHADDINRQMAILQLMMGQQISPTTGLRAMGINYKSEIQQQTEDAIYMAREQARGQEEMDQAGFAAQVAKGQLGGPPGAGAQGAQGQPQGGQGQGGQGGDTTTLQGMDPLAGLPVDPNTPQRPDEMLQQADGIAQNLMGLPQPMQDSKLRELKQRSEVMHQLVKSKMSSYRKQSQKALASATGGAPPPPQAPPPPGAAMGAGAGGGLPAS